MTELSQIQKDQADLKRFAQNRVMTIQKLSAVEKSSK